MKQFSNTYIFIFSLLMVVTVATILSVVAMQLQPMQKKNIETNKKQNILLSLNIESTKDNALDQYDKYITDSYVINSEGERLEGVDAFSVDLSKEIVKPFEERRLPIYVGTVGDSTQYIIPIRGKGLWGPIWGYIALKSDYNTIYGTNFSHDSETPGLGAEIATRQFQKQFIGKKIFNEEDEFVSVDVVKGGAPSGAPHAVDGVSGGTITSKGVDSMLEDVIGAYVPYLKEMRNKKS
ncbi:MAG: NADH:ubiquinone reductase (Na(+)-transporting) subunit C [Bacteroidales bacterium]|nr:NADH:ubiquinone reductase (Na(+)-transporting) subunit C [Bacteroidales bacterium]